MAIVLVFAQTALRPSGLSYDEELAYVAQGKAEAKTIALEYCGQPYFGTQCGG